MESLTGENRVMDKEIDGNREGKHKELKEKLTIRENKEEKRGKKKYGVINR